MNTNLFITKIILNRKNIPGFEKYPFNIEIIKNMDFIEFHKPVTFLIGENGTGKSTLLEALATVLNLNPEGGTQNFSFSTKNTVSSLANYIDGYKANNPKTKFFLRAESFYNFATEVDRLIEEDHFYALKNVYGNSLHECSHGESFIQLVQNKFTDHGLYILDEPEAALSPVRQMSLLYLINDLVKKGSQFIISTHSPILISYFDAEIIDLNDGFSIKKYQDTDIYQTYKMYLDNPKKMQELLFQEELE